jgi:class 3 adenylate cyclase/tetratricopeptide (TPR) repeat protein
MCPSCGAAVSGSGKFCSECGTALAAAPVATTAARPVAERRLCSVLFVDLVGFTPLSESRDPEAVRELLSKYFDQARTVIGRYGGAVEKFIGDAVMAVWGAPTAGEGDAERAVRAALELVEAVGLLGADVGISTLRARAGVVTGEVAVTLGAVGEGMVAGDAVNTAARVQSVAPEGQVLVDETTRRLAGAGIGFVDAGEETLKGKSAPFPVFRATRVLSVVGGLQRVDGLEAPMVGRDAELRLIKELFHASAERATPRLVVVSGPAGVGKTRLGWEFEKYIDGLADVVWWHRGRCLSYGDGIAYWALAEMVRQRFGIADEDPLDVAAVKLDEQLPNFVPDPAEQGLVRPSLARLLGVTSRDIEATQMSRDELSSGWRLFFERLALNEPVLMLVEDGQHADAALLDFLEQLADQSHRAIYIVLFTRPELIQRRPELGIGRNRTLLSLDSLDARSMHAMLDALVPDMPADAVAAIELHAQGNPLFAIETIRSLVDRDIVIPRDGVYRLVGDVGSLQVPDSLHGLLAARLDSLSPDLRALLADAAVLGTTFPAEALVAVSGRPAAAVTEALAELVRRDILEISADPLSPQRGGYVFRQNMLRQVSYDTLSRRDRKARHLAVAAHLRTVFDGDEIMEVVARHYRDAMNAVDDDPDNEQIGRLAIETLVRAGDRALSAGAPTRAAANLTEAGEVTLAIDGTAHAAAADLWVRAAGALRVASDFDDMRTVADRAAKSYAAVGDERGEARARIQAGVALSYQGRISEARAILTPATEVLRPTRDLDTVFALRELATLEMFDGTSLGSELSEEALVLGQELDVSERVLGELFQVRATAYLFASQPLRGIAMFRQAIELAEGCGDGETLLRAVINMGEAYYTTDPGATLTYSLKAYELAGRSGNAPAAMAAVASIAQAGILSGRWAEAASGVEAARVRFGASWNEIEGSTALLAALRGDLDTARANARPTALSHSEDAQDRSVPRLADAFLAAAERKWPDAFAAAREVVEMMAPLNLNNGFVLLSWPLAVRAALDIGNHGAVDELLAGLDGHPVGHVPLLLRAERELARARLAAADNEADAELRLTGAVERLRTVGSPYHLAHALLDLAAYRGDAHDLVAEAETIATDLGCGPLAERVAELRMVRIH